LEFFLPPHEIRNNPANNIKLILFILCLFDVKLNKKAGEINLF
jgi:hypothetical protein